MSDSGARSAHVSLIGFMGAGKSTVGALIAARLGVDFVDLDREIERASGASVRVIFETRGEDAFRALEARALTRALDADQPTIIATGGGAPCHGDNLERMRARGLVLALDVSLDTVAARIEDPETRPLLARPASELQRLHARRRRIYQRAHGWVATDGRTPEKVADEVVHAIARARAWPRDLWSQSTLLALGERTYPVLVSPGAIARAGELARAVLDERCSRIAVISDENVAPLHGAAVQDSLGHAGFETSLSTIPAGEPSKSFDQVMRLCHELAASGLSRYSAIVALGGGVVGDLAGFVASILFRGIAWVQMPTTLLAMIDASIGGKTGIDLAGVGKNLVGTFWQPRAVIADPDVLATLPVRDERAAMGELIKYGLLDGEPLMRAIEDLPGRADPASEPPRPCTPDASARITGIVHACAAYKCGVVSRDEHDRLGERALLNLGHTVGHAAELAGGFETLLHGEAVALGLVAACRVSAHLGLCAPGVESRVVRALERFGLDHDVAPWLGRGALDHLRADKKRIGAAVDFIAIRDVGWCTIQRIPIHELSRILRSEFTV